MLSAMVYRAPEHQIGICPLCDRALRSGTGGGFQFGACATCGGRWVDEGTLAEMRRQMKVGIEAIRWEPCTTEAVTRACPRCREPMRKMQIAGLVTVAEERLVPLDRCEAHGVWFDRAELEAVLTAAGWPPRAGAGRRSLAGELGAALLALLGLE